MIYLDNNATTDLLPCVRDAIHDALEFGPSNPASPHSAGAIARETLSSARTSLAALIGTHSERMYFTSGATEANNWALEGITRNSSGGLVTTTVEHESIRSKVEILRAQGCKVLESRVTRDGSVDLDHFQSLLLSNPSMVSVQWVNNETGVIQPIDEITKLCQDNNIPVHTDAAQAVGKLPIDLSRIPVNFLSLTGHKFHAPKGIGALYQSRESRLRSLLYGGSQERGQRPGTENLLGIAGIGAAAQHRCSLITETIEHLSYLRDLLEMLLVENCAELKINGINAPRVCNTTNIQFTGIDGDALLAQLDSRGVYCSRSSACSASLPEPSHVLLAMGLSYEEAYSSIRFSVSELNTEDQIREAAEVISEEYLKLRTNKVFAGIR